MHRDSHVVDRVLVCPFLGTSLVSVGCLPQLSMFLSTVTLEKATLAELEKRWFVAKIRVTSKVVSLLSHLCIQCYLLHAW